MAISIMNLLMITGIGLLVLITILGIKAYVEDRLSWKEIERQASSSGISGFSE